MLEDYYYEISIYRDENADTFNSFDDGNWTLQGTIQGFIQSAGGSLTFANQANVPLSTHILYTDIQVDVEEGDRLLNSGIYYTVEFIQKDVGISGVEDHQEILCTIQNDI